MKKAFTFALSIVISSSIFAASEFFIKINSNGNYTVSLNNQTMTSPDNIFRFYNLNPGYYLLTVREQGIIGRILYSKSVTLQNKFRTVAEMSPNFTLNIIDKIGLNTQQSWYHDNRPGNQHLPSCGVHGNPKHCQHTPHHPGKPKGPKGCKHCNAPNYWYNSNNGYGQPYPGTFPYPNHYPMNNQSGPFNTMYNNVLDENGLQSILQAMRNTSFDNSKLDIVKAALKNRSISTSQVSQLMQQFTFEQYKLDLAKFCYVKATDPYNFFTLSNNFTFDSYASELTAYINSR
jgi:hypothetical protein